MRTACILLRSHGAPGFLAAVAVLTGAAAAACLVDPSPELTATMPRRAWTVRCLLACAIGAGCAAAVLVSGLVPPGPQVPISVRTA